VTSVGWDLGVFTDVYKLCEWMTCQ